MLQSKIEENKNDLNSKIEENKNDLNTKIEENKDDLENKKERLDSQVIERVKKECTKYFLDLCWPVGSYYWTNNSSSPETLFGGSWTRIYGKFVYAADSNRTVNSTGGQERLTLSINEIPSHNHKSYYGRKFLLSYGSYGVNSSGDKKVCDWNTSIQNDPSEYTAYTGGGSSHENMPPYIAAYCWRRTS